MLSSLTPIVLSFLVSPPPGIGVEVIDVGQGAAALLRGADRVVLIDVGPASGAESVLRALDEHEIERIDLFVATHFDADHIAGLGPVLAGPDGRLGTDDDIEVAQVWDRGLDAPLPRTDALGLYLALVGAQRLAPEPGATFEGSGLRIERLGLDFEGSAAASENDRGLVLCVEFEGSRMLLPGDVSAPVLEAAAERCGPVDLLWVSHHGSHDAISTRAIDELEPRVAVVSAGLGNPHCHPAPATLALLHPVRTWVVQGAGLWPEESCPAITDALGPEHAFVGGDLWIEASSLQAWGHSGGAWASLE